MNTKYHENQLKSLRNVSKNSILKIAFLFIISTACSFTAKAQFDLAVSNTSGCPTLIEVLDNSSNVLYSVTNTSTAFYSCVGTSGTPVEIRYSAGGYSVIIPVGANNHPTGAPSTSCLFGLLVNSIMTTSGSCLPPATPYYVSISF